MKVNTTSPVGAAHKVHENLIRRFPGPYFATPCGVLAPLLDLLEGSDQYHVVPREDNAIGMAAGYSLAGGLPTVLMQNSGLGQSVNALASLVVPYGIPMLIIVSMRGTDSDPTEENLAMGRLVAPVLRELGIDFDTLDPEKSPEQFGHARRVVEQQQKPFALLVKPDTFSWKA